MAKQGLVAANTDYIVDGLCGQLRAIDAHPRAPALFATLLGRSGVPAALLPLLSEPARAAVRGLGITNRHRRPQHAASFLRVLIQVTHWCWVFHLRQAFHWVGLAQEECQLVACETECRHECMIWYIRLTEYPMNSVFFVGVSVV